MGNTSAGKDLRSKTAEYLRLIATELEKNNTTEDSLHVAVDTFSTDFAKCRIPPPPSFQNKEDTTTRAFTSIADATKLHIKIKNPNWLRITLDFPKMTLKTTKRKRR